MRYANGPMGRREVDQIGMKAGDEGAPRGVAVRGSKELNVLFLGGGKRVSVAEHLMARGQLAGTRVNVFSYELDDAVPIREIATVLPGKRWSECLVHLQGLIEELAIELVLPFVDPAIGVAAALQSVNPRLFSPVSSAAACETFFSKVATQRWCLRHGVPVPASEAGRFPKIAKPDRGSASKGIVILRHEAELASYTEDPTYLVQQFVQAKEYTVDAYRSVRHGNINYLVPRQRLETQGGEVIKSRTIRHGTIESLSRFILEEADLRGAVTLQFLEEENTGAIFFMEANPRFGGGVVTSVGAGVDLFEVLAADSSGTHLEENDRWEVGLLMLRRFSEIYIHADHH